SHLWFTRLRKRRGHFIFSSFIFTLHVCLLYLSLLNAFIDSIVSNSCILLLLLTLVFDYANYCSDCPTSTSSVT
ncbi:hypothetical protein VIGAN_09038300, partial [Vigna angularis var. angularis]